MSNVILDFTCEFGYESFDIYVHTEEFTESTLPEVWESGVTSLSYVIENPPSDPVYIMVASVKGQWKKYSQLMIVRLKRDFEPELNVSIKPYAFYKLNETSGDFLDYSGNNRHLTPSSTALRNMDSIDPTSNPSTAVDSTTPDAGKYIGNRTGSSTMGNILTIAMWIHIPSSATKTYGEFFKIGGASQGFSIGLNNGGNNAAYEAQHGRFLLVGQNGVSFRPSGHQFSNDAQNIHLTIKWDTSQYLIYINGEYIKTIGASTLTAPTDTFIVGKGEAGMGFDLRMSRVAIYNGALTTGDIRHIAGITPIQHNN